MVDSWAPLVFVNGATSAEYDRFGPLLWIDLRGLLSPREAAGVDVMNGIAYDAAGDRLRSLPQDPLGPQLEEGRSQGEPRGEGRSQHRWREALGCREIDRQICAIRMAALGIRLDHAREVGPLCRHGARYRRAGASAADGAR